MSQISYKKLFKLLIDRDMKEKDLAEKAGISMATITKMKRGKGAINSNVWERICQALNCKVEDILEIIKDEQPPKAVVYCRVATKEQLMNDEELQYINKWKSVSQKYCDKIGTELLFVNREEFGYRLPNGNEIKMDFEEFTKTLVNEPPLNEEPIDGPILTM